MVNILSKIKIINKTLVAFLILTSYLFLNFLNWDFYLNHYPKREAVIQAWQCGYKQLTKFIHQNYTKYRTFYISSEHGQPYIFLLYYLAYPPEKYQTQAKLSKLDQYGFGQVKRFDKFVFSFSLPNNQSSFVSIAYPHDFKDHFKDLPKNALIKKIKHKNKEIFWIYQSDIKNSFF